MVLIQPLGLQLGPDDLKRMGYGGRQHSRGYACYCLSQVSEIIHASLFEFLVKHVVEASKSALLDAAGQTPTK